MKKAFTCGLVMILVLGLFGAVEANDRRGRRGDHHHGHPGGHRFNRDFNRGHGDFRGGRHGGFHHGGPRFGIGLSLAPFAVLPSYPASPYSYGLPPAYGAPQPYGATQYISNQPMPAPQPAPAAPASVAMEHRWYYCPDLNEYYPRIDSCPSTWKEIRPYSYPPVVPQPRSAPLAYPKPRVERKCDDVEKLYPEPSDCPSKRKKKSALASAPPHPREKMIYYCHELDDHYPHTLTCPGDKWERIPARPTSDPR